MCLFIENIVNTLKLNHSERIHLFKMGKKLISSEVLLDNIELAEGKK